MNYDTLTRNRVITAFFDERDDAEEAIERLVSAGIPRTDITLVRGSDRQADYNEKGFWETLKDMFVPDDDRALYSEGLRRGGHIVTVRTTEALYTTAIDILDDEGTVDLDQRAASWRSEGWMGANSVNRSTSDLELNAAPSLSADRGTEAVIPVAEEELHVGKRDVSHGRVRVRSYVVETPVAEQVNLREEHVDVERRPVDRPLTSADNLFQDRMIEVEERAEEAVVAKEARVREEVVVRKDVENRTDTVSDTVRRTEVEVEDERGRRIR